MLKGLDVGSEQAYRLLINSMPDTSVMLFDHQQRFLVAGGGELARVGFQEQQIEGKLLREAFPPELADLFEPLNAKALQGEATTFEMVYGPFVYLQQVLPVFANGTVCAGMVIAHNITEHKQAEESLRTHEEHLRLTLDSIGDAVIATDAAGKITLMNPVAETLTGWRRPEATGRPLIDILHIINNQTGETVEDPVEKVLQADAVVGMANHTVLIAKGGARHQIADSSAPMRDANGVIIGVVLVFRDVTKQLRVEQELLKIKKLEAVGLLAGGIAHDFNNLLTALFGNLEMAKTFTAKDHKAYLFLDAACRAMESATNLTKQLLTFAKGGDPVKETLALGVVLTETAQFALRGGNVKLQTDIAPDLWAVDADRGQLGQVISNLVINAQQAMPSGGAITLAAANVEATTNGRQVRITVGDEGVGIAPEYLDKVFDPYFTTKEKGNGLGLATSHSIIRKHGGRITVDSRLNRGTTFTVYLPAADKKEKPAEKSPDEALPAAVQPARILVVDDDEAVRDVARAMLEELGYEVSLAVDGQAAIEEYRATYGNVTAYKVVITDLTIPGGMGGQEAAQEILRIDPRAKIIVSSGYATDPVMAHYERYGFAGRVVKPYRLVEIQQVMHEVLGLQNSLNGTDTV